MSEQEVRNLRTQVFCGDCSDANWQAVKHNWMRKDSLQWLKEKAGRPLSNYTRKEA